MRPLLKPGAAAPVHAQPGAHAGFDYPTQLVGVSKWKGTDGKPITVYYDPSTGNAGLTAAQYVLAHIDDLMASNDLVFGVKGASGNVIVSPDFGGAYHYGCTFSGGGDWYCSVGSGPVVFGLAQAEITESYMGLQAKGWNCGGSGGEALSRVLAEWVTGGASGALVDYASGPSWDGTDWISKDQGTDQDYPSIGCGVLYLWWMLKTYTLAQITQAGEPDGTLASNWAALTGHDPKLAFAAFQAAVGNLPAASDNPFGTPDPPYPATAPTPPTPPQPPVPPTPVPAGSFNMQISMDCTGPHTVTRASFTVTPLKSAAHVDQIIAAFELARPGFAMSLTGSSVWQQILAWLKKEEAVVAGVLVVDLPEYFLGLKTLPQVLADVEAAVLAAGFPLS